MMTVGPSAVCSKKSSIQLVVLNFIVIISLIVILIVTVIYCNCYFYCDIYCYCYLYYLRRTVGNGCGACLLSFCLM